MPPLRERRDEISGLVRTFLEEAGGASAPELSEEVRSYFMQHTWPGNVRELRNLVRRAVVLCEGNRIEMEHLFIETDAPPADGHRSAAPVRPPDADIPVRPPLAATGDSERREIVDALERFAGNQTKVARHLGISRTTLSARLDRFGIPRPRKRT